jgi:hypothetical protein
MKLKTLAMLATTSLFAATFATAGSNVMLVDESSAMGNTGGSMSGNAADTNNVGNPNDTMATQGSNSTSPSDSSNTNDDMSADTATGDDDY